MAESPRDSGTTPGTDTAGKSVRLMPLFRDVVQSFRASPVFAVYVLLTLGIAGVIGSMLLLMQVQPGFLGMGHFTDPSHRVHELTYSFLFGVALVGILAQLRRPTQNVAGMLMAVIPWAGLLLAALLSGDTGVILSTERLLVAAGTVMATLLHPAGRDFFGSFSLARVNRAMLGLVVVAAVPLLVFAFTNVGLQATLTDDHAAQGHYGFMAAFGFTAVGVGLVASARPTGWRLTAWVAGALPALLGLSSLLYPDNASSLGSVWSIAAIVWGIVFVFVAERIRTVGLPMEDTRVGISREATAGASRLRNTLGIIALVPIVLAVGGAVTMLAGGGAGGGPGGHTPGADAGGGSAPIEGAPKLAIIADDLAFSPDRIELGPGRPAVNIALTSGDMQHDLVVDEVDFHLAAERGKTAVGGLEGIAFGEPGTYVGYCSVPGHREAGMEIEIVVTAGDH
jgi:plastocyanin